MNQLATRLEVFNSNQQSSGLTGQVMDLDEDTLYVSVQSDKRVYTARKAFSCLMEPVMGDLVHLVRDESEGLYVTHILERKVQQADDVVEARLRFAGHLSLEAEKGLSLETDDLLHVQAHKLNGVTSEVSWFSKLVKLTNRELFVVTSLARLTCKVRELFAQQMHVSADHSFRHIAKTEFVRAEVYDLKASSLASMQAPCTMIKAKKLAKVDSSQVHIG